MRTALSSQADDGTNRRTIATKVTSGAWYRTPSGEDRSIRRMPAPTAPNAALSDGLSRSPPAPLRWIFDTVSVGSGPQEVVVSPDDDYVYMTNFYADTGSVISTADRSVTATLPVGDGPWDIAVSPDGCHVYTVNYFGGSMSVARTRDHGVVDTIAVGRFPKSVVVSSNGDHLYSANEQSSTVRVIGPQRGLSQGG
jgi:YVTN family beta-propeller protein